MAGRDSRWITIRTPFNFTWPSRAMTYYSEPGEQLVKNEVADFAVAGGYATEGKVDGSARSRKGGKKRVRSRKKEATAAPSADTRAVPPVGDESVPDADRAADRPPVDSDAG